MNNEKSIIVLSWDILDKMLTDVAKSIRDNEKPDVIIAIQRGGFIPAVILSHALNIRNIIPLNIRVTLDDTVNSEKMQPIIERNIDVKKVEGKKVLIVDDIIGSGFTYRTAINYLLEYQPASIKSFICVINKNNWEKYNVDAPNKYINYMGMEVRGWVRFPWEKYNE